MFSIMEMSIFEQLPDEILLEIFFNHSISAEDLVSLSNVCKRFQNTCHGENKLWRSKFEQRWPSIPKNLVLWNMKAIQVENWKKEVEDSLRIREKLEEILNYLKYKIYKFKNMHWPNLTSIYEMINIVKFGHLIALSDVIGIIKRARETSDLRNMFFAQLILIHLSYRLLSEEMKPFLQLSNEKQSLEKGIYYLSKGLQPEAFLGYEYEEVSLKLDKLAHEVQSYLRIINRNHPATSIELFSPEEPLENSKWSDEECYEIFESINSILFTEHTIRKYNNICSIFLHAKVKGNPANDGYFTVIYIAVCHRLGILLQPFKFRNKLLFKWRNLRFEYGDIAPPHNYLNWNDLPDPDQDLSEFDYTIESILLDFAYKSFYDIERVGDTDFLIDKMAAAGMILLLEYFPKDFFHLSYDEEEEDQTSPTFFIKHGRFRSLRTHPQHNYIENTTM